MRFPSKELIIAIFLGFIIGLVVTYGIWTANQAIKQKQQAIIPVTVTTELNSDKNKNSNSEDVIDESQSKISVLQPAPHTLTDLDIQVVSGTAPAGMNIILFGENDQQVTLASTDDKFSTEIPLIKGVNYLKIDFVSDDGQITTINRTVIRSDLEVEEDI